MLDFRQIWTPPTLLFFFSLSSNPQSPIWLYLYPPNYTGQEEAGSNLRRRGPYGEEETWRRAPYGEEGRRLLDTSSAVADLCASPELWRGRWRLWLRCLSYNDGVHSCHLLAVDLLLSSMWREKMRSNWQSNLLWNYHKIKTERTNFTNRSTNFLAVVNPNYLLWGMEKQHTKITNKSG
jgi:hypothetical protein